MRLCEACPPRCSPKPTCLLCIPYKCYFTVSDGECRSPKNRQGVQWEWTLGQKNTATDDYISQSIAVTVLHFNYPNLHLMKNL